MLLTLRSERVLGLPTMASGLSPSHSSPTEFGFLSSCLVTYLRPSGILNLIL